MQTMEEGSLHEVHCSDPCMQRRKDAEEKCGVYNPNTSQKKVKFCNSECYNEVQTKTRQKHSSSCRDEQMLKKLGKQIIFEHVKSVYVQENALLVLSWCIWIELSCQSKAESGSCALATCIVLVIEHYCFVLQASNFLGVDKHFADAS